MSRPARRFPGLYGPLMRWSLSVGGWSRWDTVLGGVAAVAVAGAAMSDVMKAPWLKLVGVVVAAVVAVALLVVRLGRARVEASAEAVMSDRRLRIPVTVVCEVDPVSIGVERAAQSVLPGGERPRYVSRGVDGAVLEGVTAAALGRGRWLVVVVGPSKVGKSRTLFEGVLAADDILRRSTSGEESLRVVAPIGGDALKALLVPGEGPRWGSGPLVLWLDDLEPFLNEGVTWQTLQEWRGGSRAGSPRIVVATYGGKGSERIAGAMVAGLATTAGEVLQHALEVPLTLTSVLEESTLPDIGVHTAGAGSGARVGMTVADRVAIRQSGLAAFLVAGPALERKLRTGLHAPGEIPCPAGVAVVAVVVDWARCGRTDPISEDLVRQAWPSYLPSAISASDDVFDMALSWAIRAVAGTIALITHSVGFIAYDYVVRLRREDVDAPPPPDVMWNLAISTATPDQVAIVAIIAYEAGRFADAVAAFDIARISARPATAAIASYNQGVVLSELGRGEEAVVLYRRVVRDYADDPAPEMRAQVAKTLVNLGAMLGKSSRLEDELAVYLRVVRDYGDDLTLELRVNVAQALVNRGVVLGELGRGEEAVTVYGQVVQNYADDPAPEMRVQVARALSNLGALLGRSGHIDKAVAVCQRVAQEYGDDPAQEMRAQVAAAITNQGATLGAAGRNDEAVAVYLRVVRDYADDPISELRVQVAKALNNQGAALRNLRRAEEAIAVYRRVVRDYADDPTPELCAEVARALAYQRAALRESEH